MERRRFHRLCGEMLAGAAALHAIPSLATSSSSAPWPRSRLTTDDDKPVLMDSLSVGDAWIFSYPYRTTPCFLLRLGQSAPSRGRWPGGLGDDQSIVAFSAICSHKMSHPARPISHISYRPGTVEYLDADRKSASATGVISCCSERSVYDPADGGQVLGGPASRPLAAIALEIDDDGGLVASGSHGPDQYDRFLDKFGFRLAMEYGVSDVRARIGASSIITRAEHFSLQQIQC